jgi:hypothetical protein
VKEIEIYTALQEISNSLAPSKLHQHHNPADAYFAVMIGQDLGLSPAASLQNIYNVNGRPSLYADMKLALVKRHPEYAGCDIESDTEHCTITLRRKNSKGVIDTVVSTFTIEDAARAKLTGKDNWKAYPQRMLKARALSYACNDLFPDAMIGLLSVEEAKDIPKVNAKQELIIDMETKAIDLNSDSPEAVTETEPVNEILEIKKAISAMLTKMVETNLDGFADEIRRHNSFVKHLWNGDPESPGTVNDCQDYNALVAYHDHLAAKVHGETAKPTIKQRQDAIIDKLTAMAITGEELEFWSEKVQTATRHAQIDEVDTWIAKAEATDV